MAIHPQTTTITIDTSPPGLTVFYDDTIQPAPIVAESVVGSTHTIRPRIKAGNVLVLVGRSAQSHTIVVGSSPATYVATFSGTAPSGYRDVLADAPLAYWRLGESGGATAADSSGNGRVGTYVTRPRSARRGCCRPTRTRR